VAAGIPKYINVGGWPTDRPFVVLAPQHVEDPPGFDFSSCDGAQFGGSCNMQVQDGNGNAQPAFCTTPDEVRDFIDYAVSHYNVDLSRVYITGLSCGAFGVWEYLASYGGDERSRPRSRSPVRVGPPSRRRPAPSVTRRSGHSPACSKTPSTRRAASSP
jgi:hypothetical protein